MKTLLAALALSVAVASPALAQFNAQHFGNQTYINGPNGYTATEQHFGNMTYGNDSQGNAWNTQTFGNQTYTNGSGPGFNNGW